MTDGLKWAFRNLRAFSTQNTDVVFDAYVNAEARARMAECPISSWNKYYFRMGKRHVNEHYGWTLADWEREVREELEKPCG